MKLKRFAALGLCALMAATALTACGGGTPASDPAAPASDNPASSQAASDEPITLKLSTWDYASVPYVPELVKNFEASHPNIKIDVIDIPAADYTTKLTTMLNGGSELDVILIKDADTSRSLADKGQLLTLNDRIEADKIDLADFNGLAENFNYDNKQFAMPFRTDYYVMYYNKDIFDAKNMPYPSNDWTWADFEKMAKELTGDGNYGAFLHTWQGCVGNWAMQDGKHTIMDYETGYDFYKPYYEMALRMQKDKTIPDYGDLCAAKIHYSGAFPQGNVAMMPMGTWFMVNMIDKINKGETNVNWGVATLPHPEGVEAGYVVGAATPIAVNNASKHADAAWEVVKYFTSEEAASVMAASGQFPARADDAAIQKVATMEGMPEGAAEALKVKHISLDRPIVPKVADVNQMLTEQHSMIMLGQSTIDEALAEMAKQAKDIIEG